MHLLIKSSSARRYSSCALLLALFVGVSARTDGATIQACGCSRDLAFARYIASQQERDPFAQSQPVGIVIQASLPELYKEAALIAVRTPGEGPKGELHVLKLAGDGTVAAEVIDRYFALARFIEAQPSASVVITPENYRFHFAGEVKTGVGVAYVYDVAPKKNRPGMVAGQLWMDSETGREVMLAGYLSHVPPAGQRIDIVRDTRQHDESGYARITHVTFSLPRLGRAELVITEVVLGSGMMRQPMDLQRQ